MRDIVYHMSYEELSSYLPHQGDRIALRVHVRKEVDTPRTKKNRLPTVLQEKLEAARKKRTSRKEEHNLEDMRNPHRPFGNRNTAKRNRFIEIGWIHKLNQQSTRVRKNNGAGTRKTLDTKTCNKGTNYTTSDQSICPYGMSSKGLLIEFNLDLWDFADREIDANVTVADMYETTKLPLLRFYLASSPETIGKVEEHMFVDK